MVKQYPHIATVIISTDAGTDSEGYPLPPLERTILLTCRAEPNTSNAIIYLGDGTGYNFKYILYIKAGQEKVPVDSRITQIEMTDTNQVVYSDNSNHSADVEIIIGADEDGSSTVNRTGLANKIYALERRGVGQLLRSEFTNLSGGGFTLTAPQKVKESEVFIAHVFGAVINTDNTVIAASEYVPLGSGIVRMYSKGQLNARLWL